LEFNGIIDNSGNGEKRRVDLTYEHPMKSAYFTFKDKSNLFSTHIFYSKGHEEFVLHEDPIIAWMDQVYQK
jgi:hypothetical protein